MVSLTLLGGSSVPGLLINSLLAIAIVGVIAVLHRNVVGSGYGRPVQVLVLLAMALGVLQLLPVQGMVGWNAPARIDGLPPALTVSTDLGRTAAVVLHCIPFALLFGLFGRLEGRQLVAILPYLFLGILIQIAISLVQFGGSGLLTVGFLPFTPNAGLFANQNHFAALIFVAIPLAVYQSVVINRLAWSVPVITLLVLVCLATQSLAGAYLSIGCAVVSYASVAPLSRVLRLVLLGIAAVAALILLSNPGNILEFRVGDILDRPAIWAGTLAAIPAYLPFGSGLGTFDLIYAQFQAGSDIQLSYVNHAHNEFLELVLEAGLPGLLLIVAYLIAVISSLLLLPRTPLRMGAFCGVLFLLIHSAVDYPLRTPALLAVFIFLNALIFSTRADDVRPAAPLSRTEGGQDLSSHPVVEMARKDNAPRIELTEGNEWRRRRPQT